jgi:hypothetical protein
VHNIIQVSLLTARLNDELDRAHEFPGLLTMLNTRQWLELKMRLQAVIDQAEHWHTNHQYYDSKELEQSQRIKVSFKPRKSRICATGLIQLLASLRSEEVTIHLLTTTRRH